MYKTMEDKEIVAPEGQVEESTPTEQDTPEVATQTESPVEETDKDLTEYAANKGYSEDDLANEKTAGALKMAMNAEKMAGKATVKQDEPSEDEDLDKYLDELLGGDKSPETAQKVAEQVGNLDVSNLNSQEQAVIKQLEDRAYQKAMEAVAPLQSQMRKQQYRTEIKALTEEFGKDVIKQAPAILKKAAITGNLRDATVVVLMESQLKKATSAGIETGKKAEQQAVRQQTQEVKKTIAPKISDEWADLSIEEQEAVLIKLQEEKG